jgi:hypothetical protein
MYELEEPEGDGGAYIPEIFRIGGPRQTARHRERNIATFLSQFWGGCIKLDDFESTA